MVINWIGRVMSVRFGIRLQPFPIYRAKNRTGRGRGTRSFFDRLARSPGGVLPCMGYIGTMCGAKGYGFLAVLVINRVSLLAILPPFW